MFSIIYMIRIRFFGSGELNQKGFSVAQYQKTPSRCGSNIFSTQDHDGNGGEGRKDRPFFFFFRQIFLAHFFFLKKSRFAEHLPENRLTRLFSSTIRTVKRQSICSEEIVHRASFLTGEFFFYVTSCGVCGSMFNDGRTRTHVFCSVQCSSRAAARGLAHC